MIHIHVFVQKVGFFFFFSKDFWNCVDKEELSHICKQEEDSLLILDIEVDL